MKTIEIIRNSVMQCIERIAKLSKIVEKVDNSLKLQEQNIENGKVYDSVMSNFVISQFTNFTYLYYTENGDIKSILFNDGNVSQPLIDSYVISGKPLSYRCHKITYKVEFKNFDTSAVTNMSSMFYNCVLTTLDLSSFDTSAVTDMSRMFGQCNKLTTLDLSNFNTSLVTDMSGMFANCRNLTMLDLSSFGTSAVTNMRAMFFYCSNLTTLDLSSFDTSAVTNMSNMFYNCVLTTLDLSSFDTSAVTDMSYMFQSCYRLTMLDLSSFDTSAVTDMTGMFQNCNSLTTIIGTHTLEDVQAGTIKALKGTKVSLDLYTPLLERASILALFYGLADLTGNTKQTIRLHATAKARLTAEDIKIATDKNWDVQ